MRKPKANNNRFGKRTSEFSPTASDLLKANQKHFTIGKSTHHGAQISSISNGEHQKHRMSKGRDWTIIHMVGEPHHIGFMRR